MTHLYDRHCNADVSIELLCTVLFGESLADLETECFTDHVDEEETVNG